MFPLARASARGVAPAPLKTRRFVRVRARFAAITHRRAGRSRSTRRARVPSRVAFRRRSSRWRRCRACRQGPARGGEIEIIDRRIFDQHEVARRIHARRRRPGDVLPALRIDVVVDDDDHLRVVELRRHPQKPIITRRGRDSACGWRRQRCDRNMLLGAPPLQKAQKHNRAHTLKGFCPAHPNPQKRRDLTGHIVRYLNRTYHVLPTTLLPTAHCLPPAA